MNFKYFKREEFACQETGENFISDEFIEALDNLRGICGFPFVISSGYRSKSHSLEVDKLKPGKHTEGIAADIVTHSSYERYALVKEAIAMGFNGIGIGEDFVHLDMRPTTPVMWHYY
jgi:uncharacterized protein YcbK (DUF882 family)